MAGSAPTPHRPAGDVTATTVLFVVQGALSAVCFGLALLSLIYLMMPICSDNCDSPDVTRIVHRTFVGAVVIAGGAALGLLVSGAGALVTGLRHRPGMWKWPALGLAVTVVSGLIAVGVWVN